jgi:pectate lyase
MFIANGDKVTLDRNYWHDMSGRSPKLGADGVTTTVQVTNNYFYNNKGHDFDIYPGTSALLEGNRIYSVTTPMTANSKNVATVYNVPDAASASACSTMLGRHCFMNTITSSGEWPSLKQTGVLSTMAKVKTNLVTPIAVGNVIATVTQNAGVGKI